MADYWLGVPKGTQRLQPSDPGVAWWPAFGGVARWWVEATVGRLCGVRFPWSATDACAARLRQRIPPTPTGTDRTPIECQGGRGELSVGSKRRSRPVTWGPPGELRLPIRK